VGTRVVRTSFESRFLLHIREADLFIMMKWLWWWI